jgi:hypothetical protein
VVLYEMLTGRGLFQGDNASETPGSVIQGRAEVGAPREPPGSLSICDEDRILLLGVAVCQGQELHPA